MNLDRAVQEAQTVSGPKTAARLYNAIEQELELGFYDEDQADAGEQALRILEDRYPGVRSAARDITDPPPLSRGAKSNADSGFDDELDDELDDVGEHEGRSRSRSRRGSSSPRGRRPAARRPGGRASARRRGLGLGRALGDATGVRSDDVTSTILTGLRWLLVAGIGYRILQPKGADAFATVLGDVRKGVDTFLQPVDPLKGPPKQSDALPPPIAQAIAGRQMMDTPGGGTAPARPPKGFFDIPGGLTAPFRGPTGHGIKTIPPTGPGDEVAKSIARLTNGLGRSIIGGVPQL